MSIIRMVRGDISPDHLGITYGHEHLIWAVPSSDDPDLGLDDVRAAITELSSMKAAGGGALVEMTTAELKRDPAALLTISQAVDVHIIAATGYNQSKFSSPYLGDQSVDEIAARLINDIQVGMDNTEIRAGVIKASTSKNQATPTERRVITAAGIAHQETGTPVSTHTEAGTFALEQIDLLIEAGVSPERMLIGHLDRNLDAPYHLSIARRGVYLGFDQIGKLKYASDQTRAEFIKRLVDAGCGEQIILSSDLARKSNWPAYAAGNQPGLTHLLKKFVPIMREAGLTHADIEMLLVKNPARFLAF